MKTILQGKPVVRFGAGLALQVGFVGAALLEFDHERTWFRAGVIAGAVLVALLLHRAMTRYIEQRTRAEAELRRTAEFLLKTEAVAHGAYNRSLIEASLDPLVTIGPDGKLTDVNVATEMITGRARSELVGTDFSTYFTNPEKAREGYQTVFREGSVRDFPLDVRQRKGTLTPVLYNASVYRDVGGKVIGVFAAARDITALRRTELALNRTNRALRATSACNEALVRAESEDQLLREVCRVIVDYAGYRLAWIGLAENDARKTVRPIAVAGHDDGYVANINVTWSDDKRGRGPTGRAIRSRQVTICRDMLSDPGFAPWREAARSRGFASSIVLPLVHEGAVFGALSIYASESDAFDDMEAKWLLGLGEDIAFGVAAFRTRVEREKAERELAQLQQLLNRTQAIAQVGGWKYDVVTRRSTWTDELYRIHGVSAQNYDSSNIEAAINFYAPEHRERITTAFQRAIDLGESYDLELQLTRADGRRIWIRTIGEPVRDSTGRVVIVRGSLQDITERKRAEEQVRQLNAELELRVAERTRELKQRMAEMQTILDTVPVGLAIADSPDCLHIRGNPVNERLLGVSRGGELSLAGNGPPPYRVFAKGRELGASELPMQRAAAGEFVMGQLIDVQTADGRSLKLYSNAAPLFDEARVPRGAVGAFLDITELKQAEEALRQSELRFRTIYDTAPVSIWQEDWTEVMTLLEEIRAEGISDWERYFEDHPDFVQQALNSVKILDVNQWTIGMFAARDKSELLASLQTIFATPDTLPGFVGEMVALARGEPVFRTEMLFNTVRGDRIYGLLAMVFSPPGSVLVSVIDITDRKRAENELRRMAADLQVANRELEAFAYSVSHDLRTPLRSIDGFGRILLRDDAAALSQRGRENLERVRSATQRMAKLIDDLLQLSRTARGEMHRREVNLSVMAESILEELKASDRSRSVTCLVAPAIKAMGDPVLLHAVLENLLGNSWKFTSRVAEATIEVGVCSRNSQQVFYVRDNGAGFDMQYAKKLFGAFQRLHAHEDFPGSGVGLATVQRIIHRHGGEIWAESGVNQGTTFFFTLPVATEAT